MRPPPGAPLRRALLPTVTALVLALGTAYAGTSATAATSSSAVSNGAKTVPVPRGAGAVDTSNPDHVIGHGTPGSCTSRKVVRAVARGGVITFRCGPNPVVIRMRHTAKVVNSSRRVVIDGGGLVTLSGAGRRRILWENACDPRQGRLKNCQDSPHPLLVVQHLTLARGNSSGNKYFNGGGGAIFSYGGQLRIVDSTFVGNRCDRNGADLGGGAVRARFQYHNRPVYVVHSTFLSGRCSNGAALSSLNVSWVILNSMFRRNHAIGRGANPARPGTPGGGSGGVIYTDGETYTVTIAGTVMRRNQANEGGGAIFYVSNDRTGHLHVNWSTLRYNVSGTFETRPGIFYKGSGRMDLSHSLVH